MNHIIKLRPKMSRYIEAQMLAVNPLPIDDKMEILIKVHTMHGETNWLTITGEQFKQIERILC
jgi:hypothetical protein